MVTERVHIRLCSVLTVETGGRTLSGHQLGSRKARTLVAFLAAARGRSVPIDQVVEALWPDGPPADPAASVLRAGQEEGLSSASATMTGWSVARATSPPWIRR